MGRLTTREQGLVIKCVGCVDEKYCYSEIGCDAIYDALEKLKEYEDLEEQGRLIKLHCKVGDTVWSSLTMSGWYLRRKDAPYQAKIVFIGLNDSEEDGGGFFNVCYEKNTYMMSFRFSDIGKTVFLTKAEAEKALAEMGE